MVQTKYGTNQMKVMMLCYFQLSQTGDGMIKSYFMSFAMDNDTTILISIKC